MQTRPAYNTSTTHPQARRILDTRCEKTEATRARSFSALESRTAKSLLHAVVISDGLSTHTFPAASAPAAGFNSSPKGKFHGATMVTTPNGSFQAYKTGKKKEQAEKEQARRGAAKVRFRTRVARGPTTSTVLSSINSGCWVPTIPTTATATREQQQQWQRQRHQLLLKFPANCFEELTSNDMGLSDSGVGILSFLVSFSRLFFMYTICAFLLGLAKQHIAGGRRREKG